VHLYLTHALLSPWSLPLSLNGISTDAFNRFFKSTHVPNSQTMEHVACVAIGHAYVMQPNYVKIIVDDILLMVRRCHWWSGLICEL